MTRSARTTVPPALVARRCALVLCPNCGGPGLRPGFFRWPARCPDCALALDRGDGFYLGSMSLSYGLAVFGGMVPMTLVALASGASLETALTLGAGVAILIPVALYKATKAWWLGIYFYFLPQELPANRGQARAGPDDGADDVR